MADYAIVHTGGKQYRVSTGDTIRVESIPGDIGDTVELTDVRMVSRDGQVALGAPSVDGVRVVTEISDSGKGKKIVVFKYKSKVRYRRKKGHRQHFTDLTVTDILYGDEPEPEVLEVADAPAVEEAAEAPAAEDAAEAPEAVEVAEAPAAEDAAVETEPNDDSPSEDDAQRES